MEEPINTVPRELEPLTRAEYLLLVTACGILVTQWLLVALFVPFFPLSGPGSRIPEAVALSSTIPASEPAFQLSDQIKIVGSEETSCRAVQGVIFAAFPAGTTICSPFIGGIMARFGTRQTVLLGLFLMSALTALFGAIPLLQWGSSGAFEASFVVVAFAYGAGSALAETGIYAVVTEAFTSRLGKVLALTELMTGVGSMLGPFIGGALYDAAVAWPWASQGDAQRFATPFLVLCPLPLLMMALAATQVPQLRLQDDTESSAGGLCTGLTGPRCAILCITGVGALAYSALNPTLQPHFHNHSETFVGSLLFVAGGLYMSSSVVLGNVVDRLGQQPAALSLLMGLGLAALTASYAILGPLKFGPLDLQASLTGLPVAFVGLALNGLGCALAYIPSLPALLQGLDDHDQMLRANLTGLSLSCYAAGLTLGPVVGSSLMGLRTPFLCQDPSRPVDQGGCFEGFATCMSMIIVTFLLVTLLLPACCTGNRRPCKGRGRKAPSTTNLEGTLQEPFVSSTFIN